MTYRYQLADYFEDCPKAWRNLIRSFPSDTNGVKYNKINQSLSLYNGIYTPSKSGGAGLVEFETEADALMFILQWT